MMGSGSKGRSNVDPYFEQRPTAILRFLK